MEGGQIVGNLGGRIEAVIFAKSIVSDHFNFGHVFAVVSSDRLQQEASVVVVLLNTQSGADNLRQCAQYGKYRTFIRFGGGALVAVAFADRNSIHWNIQCDQQTASGYVRQFGVIELLDVVSLIHFKTVQTVPAALLIVAALVTVAVLVVALTVRVKFRIALSPFAVQADVLVALFVLVQDVLVVRSGVLLLVQTVHAVEQAFFGVAHLVTDTITERLPAKCRLTAVNPWIYGVAEQAIAEY